ncbi:MAG: putative membrane protein YecN with MAPEG domain [Zhongshania sp.]|jgi:uncharacterized membrane protein YecN with MAPEG domain
MFISLICITFLGLLSFVMGIAVTIARGKFDILTGCPTDPENTLNKLVRAHGNTCEYAGILAVIIYILGQSTQSSWVLSFMIVTTFCRFLLVASFIISRSMAKPNPMRFIGAVGTYIFGLGLCFALFQQSINL